MHDPAAYIVLRIIHIVSGVFWVGTTLFLAGFLVPAVRASGPAAGPIMEQLGQVRRLPLYMMAAAILVVVSGGVLMWLDAAAAPGVWMRSWPGRIFSLGGALAIVGGVVGSAVNSPAGRRLGAIVAGARARGGPPNADELAEMTRLQARLATATNWVAVLLVLATVAMAMARYTG
jgi:uncharacterized membrane protein